ncbi:ribosome biogenesis GTP-binding protein YihA/YsxC [Oceanisphaera arctica]|uniref:Probable GTP-binding protein EngB n=1 Tax=Oceanisphaera arctica TaxID=641510 RepID=A0A2P5TLV4_9GAMM|nr:ribosome biogenesis GTP-binding protein YihA/YsxC [Oceanisphaera arctica]PPL16364.1 YihA family ribosome biogenesis GTP-binding protein [Oceanisphaera arctica]GHA14204.1 putative GTP-binding protein EngB [Oceanisphaera arctica]
MNNKQINFNTARFITSAPDINQMPADSGIEIAFAGRSNAGKSSALNTITQQKSLARTSKTPGRTQLINVFELSEGKRLIDLPGYGYAKVPEEMKLKWQQALSVYLQQRESLKGLVVLMDIRHPLKDIDQQLLQWASESNLPVLALLTKCDKLKPGPRKSEVLRVREAVTVFGGDIRVESFSSLKGLGLDRAREILSEWLLQDDEPAADAK